MLDQTQVCCPACTSLRVIPIGKHQPRYRCKVCGHRFTVFGKKLGILPDLLAEGDSVATAAISHTSLVDPNLDMAEMAANLESQEDEIDPYQEALQSSFAVLQSLLTQYPTMRQMVQTQPQLPAQNVVALFVALDNLIDHWQIEPIGAVWAKVAYDPQLHQGDQGDLELGEDVYVRFMGYRRGEIILVPARVSRQLPPALAPS